MTTKVHTSINELDPPEEFYKIINDFISDILITFPEYSPLISKWWNRLDVNTEETRKKETLFVFRHCVKVFPERFFDILYKKSEIFCEESVITTEFLPGIVFKQIWNADISDNTKETIWKYLQLILFTVIGTVHNTSEFGDTGKLFEGINEDDLKTKLEETLEGMKKMFSEAESNSENEDSSFKGSGINMENIPNAEEIHDHINSMMDGSKLGRLALELAEETAKDLDINLDTNGMTGANDIFDNLIKNPAKMMNMVKNIGGKLDSKIKSGELKESELMTEGLELFNKMKNMPGMADMQQMFSQMNMPGLGKGGKMNMGAMETQMNRNIEKNNIKERIRAKAEMNRLAKEQAKTAFCNLSESESAAKPRLSDEELIKMFSSCEKPEKTPRGTKPPTQSSNKKQKKKSKK